MISLMPSRSRPGRAGFYLAAFLMTGIAGVALPAPASGQGYGGGSIRAPEQTTRPRATSVTVGSEAPDFRLGTLKGPRVALSELRGKVVLLDFWGTWCAPCRAAVPELKKLAKEMAAEPFVLVSISDERNPRKLEEFTAAHGMDWPQAWDDEQRVTRATYKVSSFPTYILVGADGRVLHVQSGWGSRAKRELRKRVRDAVAAARPAPQPAVPGQRPGQRPG